MVALGCKYLRICHLNNCTTGIATQHNVLRSKYFTGLPEMVINYFRFVAEEVRDLLAPLGVRTLAELIGRTEYLEVQGGSTPRQRKLDLTPILSAGGMAADAPQFCVTPSNAPFDQGELAERMVRDMRSAIENGSGGEWHYELSNFNRSIGARVSGEIARRWGNYGMEGAPLTVRCRRDRKSTRLNSSHSQISYAVFCLKKKKSEDLAFDRITSRIGLTPRLSVPARL